MLRDFRGETEQLDSGETGEGTNTSSAQIILSASDTLPKTTSRETGVLNAGLRLSAKNMVNTQYVLAM